jgi:hypothetical protein
MRDAYHEELDSIGDGLVEMARLVGSAIGRATTAILDSDLKLAEHVIEADLERRVPGAGAKRSWARIRARSRGRLRNCMVLDSSGPPTSVPHSAVARGGSRSSAGAAPRDLTRLPTPMGNIALCFRPTRSFIPTGSCSRVAEQVTVFSVPRSWPGP